MINIFIDLDFNKESIFELGDEWPFFNDKRCTWRLYANLRVSMCPIHQIGWYATYSDKFKNGILTNKDELVKPISSSLNSNNR